MGTEQVQGCSNCWLDYSSSKDPLIVCCRCGSLRSDILRSACSICGHYRGGGCPYQELDVGNYGQNFLIPLRARTINTQNHPEKEGQLTIKTPPSYEPSEDRSIETKATRDTTTMQISSNADVHETDVDSEYLDSYCSEWTPLTTPSNSIFWPVISVHGLLGEIIASNVFLATFDSLLSRIAGYNNDTEGSGGTQNGNRAAANTTNDGSTRNAAQTAQRKRQTRSNDPSPPNGDDSDDSDDEPSDPKRPKFNPSGRRFACPFYRRDPLAFGDTEPCARSGWQSIHRLKYVAYLCFRLILITTIREHIYRKHRHECRKCQKVCGTAEKVKAHFLNTHCELVENFRHNPLDGITHDQYEQIKNRAWGWKSDDATKWKHLYKIIFPDADENGLPSPCKPNNPAWLISLINLNRS